MLFRLAIKHSMYLIPHKAVACNGMPLRVIPKFFFLYRTLAEHFGKLVGNEKKQRFLFPLCGKSVDMKW